jgi:hypothetical protein
MEFYEQNSPGGAFDAFEKRLKRNIVIDELNPTAEHTPPPPLCNQGVRFAGSGMPTAVFSTHEAERLIPIDCGEVKIIPGAMTKGKTARSRLRVRPGLGNNSLRIISCCPGAHEIVLGNGELIRFLPEVGANCELVGIGGRSVPIGMFKAELVYE